VWFITFKRCLSHGAGRFILTEEPENQTKPYLGGEWYWVWRIQNQALLAKPPREFM